MLSKLRLGCLALLVSGVFTACNRPPQTAFVTEVPWGLTGRWLVLDTHSHTTFSDGKQSVSDVVEQALLAGCDALAITDHSDPALHAASPDYFDAINAARKRFPSFVLFAGLEWNVPLVNPGEHAGLLVVPSVEGTVLPEFKRRFDGTGETARAALDWLGKRLSEESTGALIVNHPSREKATVRDVQRDMETLRSTSQLFVGFEGAPGHQKATPVGAYSKTLLAQDRWDQAVSQVGGVWDTFLDKGESFWGALAASDFHAETDDYVPCAFSRTHIQVPERTHAGILRALRAGTFWSDHGRILDRLTFVAMAPGLPLPAQPGETIRLSRGQALQLKVDTKRGQGAAKAPLGVEIIGNARSGRPEVMLRKTLTAKEDAVVFALDGLAPGADKRTCYFRVRIRAPGRDGKDLLAYSNPIRVLLQEK
jgi:hypothetical protein